MESTQNTIQYSLLTYSPPPPTLFAFSKKLSNFCHHSSWHRESNNYVAKSYMVPVDRRTYFDDVKLQMEAKLWSEEYNRHNPPKKVRTAGKLHQKRSEISEKSARQV